MSRGLAISAARGLRREAAAYAQAVTRQHVENILNALAAGGNWIQNGFAKNAELRANWRHRINLFAARDAS